MRRLTIVFASLLIGASALAEPVSAPSGPLPVEQFTRFDEFGTLKIAPDGEHYAVLTGRYGRGTIGFIRLKDKKIVGSLLAPEGFVIEEFWWVSNSRIVFTIGEQEWGLKVPVPTGEIFASNIDATQQRFLYGYRAGQMQTGSHIKVRQASYAYADVISTRQHDDRHVLLSELQWGENGVDAATKPYIVQLDVYTGEKKTVDHVPLGTASLLLDSNERVRFGVGLNDKFELAVTWKPKPESPWVAFDLPGFRKESVFPQLFENDDRSVLFTATPEGETASALFRVDLETKQVSKVFGFESSGISDLVSDFENRHIVGVVGYGDRPERHWLDADNRAAKLYQALFKAFPDQNVQVTSTSEDGRLAIVEVRSDVNPGDYYIFDTAKKTADYLQSSRRWIDPAKMRPKESFAIKARDGVELHGYVTRAAGDGPHPLVVAVHGGPHSHDSWGFDWESQLLANHGYSVLQVNFRGSDNRDSDFERAGDGQWGKAMQDDVTDATRWAIEQKIAPANSICIYGGSYGGYAALEGAVREPSLYRCAIGYAGVYDLELMFSSADVPRSASGRAYLARTLGTDKNEWHARSPVYNADKIEVPVLLIHGKADWRADFEQATRMKAALEKSHKQFEWMALKREGHGVFDEESRRDVYTRILEFLDHNIGGARTAAN
jgi:dipeptidyl aminopeptidase/acylaminoacyl peptidase